MKRNLFTLKWIITTLIIFGIITISSFTIAGERIIIEGFVNTIKTSTGGTTVIILSTEDKGQDFYNIHPDKKGKILLKEMEGKLVEIIADISVRDGETWLEVRSYKEIKK
jgi:hypothetical protein